MLDTSDFLATLLSITSAENTQQTIMIALLSLNPNTVLECIDYQIQTTSGYYDRLTLSNKIEMIIRLRVVKFYIENISVQGQSPLPAIDRNTTVMTADDINFCKQIYAQYNNFKHSRAEYNKAELKLLKTKTNDTKQFYITTGVISYIYDHLIVSLYNLNTTGYLPYGVQKALDNLVHNAIAGPLLVPQVQMALPPLADKMRSLQQNYPAIVLTMPFMQALLISVVGQLWHHRTRIFGRGQRAVATAHSIQSPEPNEEQVPLLSGQDVDFSIAQLQNLTARITQDLPRLPTTRLVDKSDDNDSQRIFVTLMTISVFTYLTYLSLYGEDETKALVRQLPLAFISGGTYKLSEYLWIFVGYLIRKMQQRKN